MNVLSSFSRFSFSRASTRASLRLLAGSLLASAAVAQQIPPTPPGTPAADEAVVLSPFQVNAEQDTGYLATTAQSGTRLRTELKDIASSISVVCESSME